MCLCLVTTQYYTVYNDSVKADNALFCTLNFIFIYKVK